MLYFFFKDKDPTNHVDADRQSHHKIKGIYQWILDSGILDSGVTLTRSVQNTDSLTNKAYENENPNIT